MTDDQKTKNERISKKYPEVRKLNNKKNKMFDVIIKV